MCNNKKAQNDTFFRGLLVSAVFAATSPSAQNLRQGALFRSIQYGSSQFADEARRANLIGQFKEYRTPAGFFVPQPLPSKERVKNVLVDIVRGLTFAYTKHRLLDNIPIDIIGHGDLNTFIPELERWRQGGGQHRKVGDGSVFWCDFLHSTLRPDVNTWFLCFYEHVTFLIMSDSSNLSIMSL